MSSVMSAGCNSSVGAYSPRETLVSESNFSEKLLELKTKVADWIRKNKNIIACIIGISSCCLPILFIISPVRGSFAFMVCAVSLDVFSKVLYS